MNSKIKYFLIISAFFLIVYSLYVQHENKAESNIEKSKKIQIGHTKEEVLRIMGLPSEERVSDGTGKLEKYLYYISPFGASNEITIILDIKTDTVKEVTYVEE